MAAGATEEDVKQISQVMAQRVRKMETGNAAPEPSRGAWSPVRSGGLGRRVLQWSMRTWIQQNGHRGPRSHQEELVKRDHRKEAIGEEMQTGRRRFLTCSVSGSGPNSLQCPLILRFPDLAKRITQDLHTPQPKLFGDQFEAIGQWATNLTSKSEVDVTPLLAQVGECRQTFIESFEKESYLLHLIDQLGHPRHSQSYGSIPLLVSPEPEGDFAHTQQFSDYLSLFQVGDECDESRHVSAQMQICDRSGKERNNPFCHHPKRGGLKHTCKKRKLEICQGCGEYPPLQRDNLE